MMTPSMRKRIRRKNRDARGTSDYVCLVCGNLFLTPEQRARRDKDPLLVTMHEGECDVCHEVTGVTHVRAFNYLLRRPV